MKPATPQEFSPLSPSDILRPRRGRKKAFTILEVMIAISIFTMMLFAMYSAWASILRGSREGLKAAAEVQRTRVAMRCITEALMSVQMFAANINDYAFIADTSTDFAYLSLVAYLPRSYVGSGFYEDMPLRRVIFTVEQAKDSTMQLSMYQQPLLLETNYVNENPPIVLARDISLFALEFWDTRVRDWVTEWIYTNQLPKLVRVSLGYGHAQGRNGQPLDLETREVAISGMVVPREFQTPRIGAALGTNPINNPNIKTPPGRLTK